VSFYFVYSQKIKIMVFNENISPEQETASKWLFALIVVGAMLVCLSSCGKKFYQKQDAKKAKKALQSFKKLDDKYATSPVTDTASAHFCATKFPTKESTTVKYKFLPGKPVIKQGETVYVKYNCDSAVAAQRAKGRKDSIIRIPVPLYEKVDTQQIIRSVVKKDPAYESLLLRRAENAEKIAVLASTQNNDLRGKIGRKNKLLIGSVGLNILWLLLVALYLYLRKK